jgi:hypothetical protein
MLSSGSCATWFLLRSEISKTSNTSIIGVTRIGELETTLELNSNRNTLRRNAICSVHLLLVAATIVPNSPIIVTLMIKTTISTEMSVLTRTARRHIPEDGIFYSHRHEILKPYTVLTGWAV